MKRYKVEGQTFYSKFLGSSNHIAEASARWAEETIERYTQDGWSLASTDATSYGMAVYMFLYFERED